MNIRTMINNAVADLVRLGRIIKVDDSAGLQRVDVNVRVGVIDTKVPRIQNYGFSSVPDATEKLLGVEITCNGNRFVIALDDLNRPAGNAPGEVMMWHKNGDFIHMKNGNAIDVQTETYTLNCETQIINANTTYMNCDVVHNGDETHNGNREQEGDLTLTGNSTITGDTDQTGTITASVDVIAAGKSGATHTHNHDHNHPGSSTNPTATDGPN